MMLVALAPSTTLWGDNILALNAQSSQLWAVWPLGNIDYNAPRTPFTCHESVLDGMACPTATWLGWPMCRGAWRGPGSYCHPSWGSFLP